MSDSQPKIQSLKRYHCYYGMLIIVVNCLRVKHFFGSTYRLSTGTIFSVSIICCVRGKHRHWPAVAIASIGGTSAPRLGVRGGHFSSLLQVSQLWNCVCVCVCV